MPCPVGLAWLLLGCSRYIPIAKAMPKGSYGINVALCDIMRKFTKLIEIILTLTYEIKLIIKQF